MTIRFLGSNLSRKIGECICMVNVTLDDLKFIENPKNRKAFLIALREVEEEGFDFDEATKVLSKQSKLEKEKLTAEDVVIEITIHFSLIYKFINIKRESLQTLTLLI